MHCCIDLDALHQHGKNNKTLQLKFGKKIWVSFMVHLHSKSHIICNTLVSLVCARQILGI